MATTSKWGKCMHQHTSIVQLFSYLFVTMHINIRRSFTNLKKRHHIVLWCAVQCSEVQNSAMYDHNHIGYIQISNTHNTIEQNNRYKLLYNALWKDDRFSYREREREIRLARAFYSIINIYYFCPENNSVRSVVYHVKFHVQFHTQNLITKSIEQNVRKRCTQREEVNERARDKNRWGWGNLIKKGDCKSRTRKRPFSLPFTLPLDDK